VETSLIMVVCLVLLLAWANGANDMSKGVATLMGSGTTSAKKALIWGTVCTALGGLTAVTWGAALVKTFSRAFLVSDFPISYDFLGSTMVGACLWLVIATRVGWPVSTTHALLGSLVGAALAEVGPEGLRTAAIAKKALLPLLLSPLIAVFICTGILSLSRFMTSRVPLRQIDCNEPAWQVNPYRCVTEKTHGKYYRRLPHLWEALHWLSGGAISFARGLNDVPKIAAILIMAFGIMPELTPFDHQDTVIGATLAVTLVMAAGGLWNGYHVLQVLAHKVVPIAPASGLAANTGTSLLVLAASPLGIPVSTTHVSIGSLFGIRLTDKTVPDQGDALRTILFAWLITLPVAGFFAAAASGLI